MINTDLYYEQVRRKSIWTNGDFKIALDFIKAHLGTLLEIGAAGSRLREFVSNYVGLDPYLMEGLVRGAWEHLPFPDNSFDIIFSSQTLQMVSDPRRCLEESMRVVKPGGYIIIIAPNLERPWSTVPSTRFYSRAQHVRLFLMRLWDSIARLFGAMPFRVISQNYIEVKGVFENPDDDMKYISSACEVARLFRKNNFRIIDRKGYLAGGMRFIFQKP